MENIKITVNDELREVPIGVTLEKVAELFGDRDATGSVFIVHNGNLFNGLLDKCDIVVADGDVIQIYPLVIGG